MLDRKQFLIIQKLVENQIISKDDLQKDLDLTSRQIDYGIEKINDILKLKNLDVINFDGAFVSVPADSYDYLISISGADMTPDKYILNRQERRDLLFLLLINGNYININDLKYTLDISTSTMHKDLNDLRKLLEENEINIDYKVGKGYRISGEEFKIRYLINTIIVRRITTNNYNILNWFFNIVQGQDTDNYRKLITEKAKKYKISFVEDHQLQFIYTYIAELTRIREYPDFIISNTVDKGIEKTEEYKLAKELLAVEGVHNSNSILYVTVLLLCTTMGGENKFGLDDHVFILVHNFVKEFCSISGINFVNYSEIEDQIFTHFRSMYYRKLYGFPVVNPFTDQIKNTYNDVFVLVQRALLILKDSLGRLPDSEVAFLTLHLMNFIYSNSQRNVNKTVAAIVCQNGIATSTLLYLQLTNIFPDIEFLSPFKYTDLKNKIEQEKIDIIFSTFYKSDLFTMGKICLIVKPIMTSDEKILIAQKVHALLNHQYPSLTLNRVLNTVEKYVDDKNIVRKIGMDLNDQAKININSKERKYTSKINLLNVINPEMIQLNVEAENATDAVWKSGMPLIKYGKVTQKYIEDIIEEKNRFDNFIIAPYIALPHSSPDKSVKQIGLSITSLKKTCAFGDKFGGEVKYIFTLCALDRTTHLRVLKDLMELIIDKNFFDLLDKGNKTDVMAYIIDKLN